MRRFCVAAVGMTLGAVLAFLALMALVVGLWIVDAMLQWFLHCDLTPAQRITWVMIGAGASAGALIGWLEGEE